MNNLNRLTSRQFAMGWVGKTTSILILAILTEIVKTAGRDAWLAVIIGSFIGAVFFAVLLKLASQLGRDSLAQWSKKNFGKFFGFIITAIYILFFITLAVLATNQYGQIMEGVFLPEDPIEVYYLLLIIPAVYAVLLGISVSYRLNETLLPFLIIVNILLIALNFPDMDFSNILPILEKGPLPVIQGALEVGSKFSFFAIILALYPLIDKPQKLKKHCIIAIVVIMLLAQLNMLIVVIFGADYAASINFGLLELTRNITVSEPLSRLDAVAILIWVTGIFIFVTHFIYGAAVLTRDLLGLKRYQGMAVFYGLLIIVINIIWQPNIIDIKKFTATYLVYIQFAIGIVLPLLLIMATAVKKGLKRGS